MTKTTSNALNHRSPLRLWPGVVAALLLVLIRFVIPFVAPEVVFFGIDAPLLGVLGGVVAALVIVVWWLFFSRAPWSDRIGAIVMMIAAVVATRPLTHISIQNGMMGMMFFVYAIPITLSLALVAWAAATRELSAGPRGAAMVAAMLIGCGVWTLARTNGILGGVADLEWRWTPTAEERLLAQESSVDPTSVAEPAAAAEGKVDAPAAVTELARAEPVAPADTEKPVGPAVNERGNKPVEGFATSESRSRRVERPAMSEPSAGRRPVDRRVEWPGFRGPARDSVVRGVQIESNWSQKPPVQIWRRPVGPGWSSFAIRGDLIYTQEQRGDEEVVSAYNIKTGEPAWRHRDAVRFWESNGGAGPRGTPTVHNGRVYAMGATGILNVLDADNGATFWSRNAATDTGVTVPDWGIASSPLVVDDAVIVAVSGRLAAYDIATGNQRWLGPAGGAGYSSPHLLTIDGVPHVLLLRGSRTISVAPADGQLLWEHTWEPGVSIVQPAVISDGEILITVGDGMGGLGVRRLAVKREAAGWKAEERWTSRGLKPYFNDFVVHEGHAYGFDGSILASIDLSDGQRKWKGGRYGNGQMVLLADQDLLLVMSEEGELALVSASPDKFTELARFPALHAKTWNHPVLVGEVLLVRNGEEMVAFRMPLASR